MIAYYVSKAGAGIITCVSGDVKPTSAANFILLETDTGTVLYSDGGGGWDSAAPGAAAWGTISGTLSDQTDLQAALDTKGTSDFSGVYADLTGKPTLGTAAATAATDYATAAQGATADTALQPAGNGGSLTGLTKTQVGLANADNTSDANKPVSTATQTALNLKANLASPTFTGTVAGVTKAMVGLTNADDTSDANKPVSTATQTALNLKANLASPTFTGTVAGITATMVGLGNVTNTSDANKPVSTAQQTALDLKANLASPTFTGTVAGITATMVGLGNVTNTSDANKPVSTAQQTALDLKSNLASPTFTGTPAMPAPAAGTNTTQAATTAYAMAAAPNPSYRTLLDCSGSHIAGRVAGTYFIPQSQPLGISGTGTLYPPNTIYIDSADFPTVNGLTTKLRIRVQLYVNDVAPTGNYTFGLYPITRPATSGGAGLCIYTLGTVVSGSNGASFTTPAVDAILNGTGSDFAIPANGHYVIGVVTTGTVAVSSLVQVSAQLQLRNT